ncbi:MAG: mannose-6-phosphate isomerase [Candidatus Methanofastidiosa archaeon]|nr:mannose-6-phosphate isomerase [Candidatus Methanofastidiosa archaeon]
MNKNIGKRDFNFDMNPVLNVPDTTSIAGYSMILKEIMNKIEKLQENVIVAFDYHYGIDSKKFFDNIIDKLDADLMINMDDLKYSEEVIYEKIKTFVEVHGEMGKLSTYHLKDFFDPDKMDKARDSIKKSKGLIVVYGVGAGILTKGDLFIYCNVEQNTIHKRFSNGMDNWGVGNYDADPAEKIKRYSCVDARALEWHKRTLFEVMDYMVDCNDEDNPVMVTGKDFTKTLNAFLKTPFKMVPFFTPGVWGGRWQKDMLGADESMVNTAWGTIGIMDFQCVKAKCGENEVCFPARDIILYNPIQLLGHQVFFLFGYRCPITMDYLDTWGGQHLSLQVHPTCAYCQEVFNYPFAHNESYYVMDATDHSSIFLGTKTGVRLDELVDAFQEAQKSGKFDETKYINRWPVKKHDHVYIPSGTIHSAAKDTVVLEIDTTVMVTFKLWDWGRLDLNGKPRPISIEHGAQVIQERRQTEFVKENLMSKHTIIDEGDGWRKEHSGLMDYELLTVDRYWFTKTLFFDTKDFIKQYCLVEGEEAIIESPNGEFEPLILHYAEAVVVPASVGQHTIKPYGKSIGKELAILECYMSVGSKPL